LYEAVDYAAQFTHALGEAKLAMDSLADGVQRYSRFWYQLDQLYRKFTYHVRMSGQASLMGSLTEQIENLYSNNYLLKLGDRFQTFVDAASKWEAFPLRKQKEFFEHWVRPFLRKDNKVCVIISDAMRYEIGDELLSLIRQEDRYSAELEPAFRCCPATPSSVWRRSCPTRNWQLLTTKPAPCWWMVKVPRVRPIASRSWLRQSGGRGLPPQGRRADGHEQG
jgi:hypothetical protein